jgi:hypothetical protein
MREGTCKLQSEGTRNRTFFVAKEQTVESKQSTVFYLQIRVLKGRLHYIQE